MEDNPYSALKNLYSSVSAKALNISSRLILANNLDYQQVLLSEKNYARDYRGLAELIGLPYCVFKKIEESENRTMKILESWETRPDATIDKLISFLEDMDRHDVIEALIPSLKKNVEAYLEYQKSQEIPIQVPEVTSGPISVYSRRSVLTRDDLRNKECTIYDAYVSYADEDSSIVVEFARYLESPSVGLKLFIRGRDMLAGCSELDTNIEMIKNRCKHMLIFLTPNFISSPSLEFQVSFAGSLAIEQRQRILVPLVLATCEIPPILSTVSKIDFTKECNRDWMWEKLVASLQPEDNVIPFLSPSERSAFRSIDGISNSPCSASIENGPIIDFPPTVKYTICPGNDSNAVLTITPADTSDDDELGVCHLMNDSDKTPQVKKSVPSSSKTSSKRFHLFRIFKKKGHSSDTSSTSDLSDATSGYQSESRNSKSLESLENFSGHYTDHTTM